jgi:hypothetical protein
MTVHVVPMPEYSSSRWPRTESGEHDDPAMHEFLAWLQERLDRLIGDADWIGTLR